jgi:hypothetical protein
MREDSKVADQRSALVGSGDSQPAAQDLQDLQLGLVAPIPAVGQGLGCPDGVSVL